MENTLKATLQRIEKIIFSLLILFLPTQFGKHFWFSWTSVAGIRIDYLSPTLYFTDILIFLLFIFWLASCFKKDSRFKIQDSRLRYFIYVFIPLVLGILFSQNPFVGWYGLVKLLEFIFVGFYTKAFISKYTIRPLLSLFAIGILFESSLSLLQYFHHGSLGGVFYFLGERAFTQSTPGIANASINGTLLLRPYGTFSHPNVLAGFLVIAMTIVAASYELSVTGFKKVLYGLVIIIGTLALLATLSRTAILSWLIILFFFFFKRFLLNTRASKIRFSQARFLFFFTLLTAICIFASFYFGLFDRFTTLSLFDESVVQRELLAHASFLMFIKHPFFGVGLNNFLVNLPLFLIPTIIFYLQPVHNIFLLVLSETGVIGFAFFLWFLFKTFKKLKMQSAKVKTTTQKSKINNKLFIIHDSRFMLFATILFLGLFDHYFLTLQQGQLLFSFVLGFCWANRVS